MKRKLLTVPEQEQMRREQAISRAANVQQKAINIRLHQFMKALAREIVREEYGEIYRLYLYKARGVFE